MDKSINTEGDVVADYVAQRLEANKEALLLGLTYLNRFGIISTMTRQCKDLSAYKFDFFGNHKASTLDTIVHSVSLVLKISKAKGSHLAYDTTPLSGNGW